jgi:hypothetical protein
VAEPVDRLEVPQRVRREALQRRKEAQELEVPDESRRVDAQRHLRVVLEPTREAPVVVVGEGLVGELDDPLAGRRGSQHLVGERRADEASFRLWRRIARDEAALGPRLRVAGSPVADHAFLGWHRQAVPLERTLAYDRAAVRRDDVDVRMSDLEQRRAGDRLDGRWLGPDPVQQPAEESRPRSVPWAAVDVEHAAAREAAVAQRDRPELARLQVRIRLGREGVFATDGASSRPRPAGSEDPAVA